MKRTKLAIIFAFIIIFIGFELSTSDRVTGQSGGSGLGAPTGLTASDSQYNSKVGLYWDTIRGAATYRIFRNTVNNPATATDVGTTASNTFFDTTATPAQTLFYWVRAENGAVVSDFSIADQGTRTNTTGTGLVTTPLAPPPVPPANPITATKIYLGKTLFWDEQMSSTRTVACGTCHHSANGGTDPRSVAQTAASTNPGLDLLFNTADDVRGSLGVPSNNADGTYSSITTYGLNAQVTGRKTVSYVNGGYSPTMFWDGRATGTFRDPITNAVIINNGGALESQVIGPPLSTAEMAHGGRNWPEVAARMATSKPLALAPTIPAPLNTWINGRSYPELFEEAFGTPDVTPARIALAIGTFERSLYTDRAPIDLVAQGIGTLTAAEQRGLNIFFGPGTNCNVCHSVPQMTNHAFFNIGVRPDAEDTGREQVTGLPNDRGAFRVPSLRNVELRGSYFHNGRFTTLEEVVAFYNRGGDFDPNNQPNLIHPLGLNPGQQADLVAFLKRPLTDTRVASETERFDRPGLYMDSNRVPQITGTGRAGSGAATPQIKAISPPLVGNPNFTVSVSAGLGNAPAVMVIDAVDPGVGTSIPVTGSLARVAVNTQNTGAGNGWASVSIAVPDSAALVGQTFFARWYIQDPGAANGFSVSQAARFTVFGEASAVGRAKYIDFDGDGRTDVSVYRPTDGTWYIHKSGDNTFTSVQFGIATDRMAPGDYDGDGKTDIGLYRDGTWYLWKSRDGISGLIFGLPGDIPQPGDYDGDAIDDVAVYRPSDGIWYIQQSRDGFIARAFGIATDRPVAADYDGDGKTDSAIYRDGTWWILKSTGGTLVTQFGSAEDKPVVGDYDGDGKADTAVWRPSTGVWYHLRSSDGGDRGLLFGIATDIPSPGDYDGDGSNDFTVYRPSTGVWYLLHGNSSFRAEAFGLSQDRPVPSAIVP